MGIMGSKINDEFPSDESRHFSQPGNPEISDNEIGPICIEAILFGNSLSVVSYLLNQMKNPKDYRNSEGESLLHHAVDNNNWKITQRVLDLGIDPNVTDDYGWTPMHFMHENNNTRVLDMLVESGAQFHIEDADEDTPFSNMLDCNNFRMAFHLLTLMAKPLTDEDDCYLDPNGDIHRLIGITDRQRRRSHDTPEQVQLFYLLQESYYNCRMALPWVELCQKLERSASTN